MEDKLRSNPTKLPGGSPERTDPVTTRLGELGVGAWDIVVLAATIFIAVAMPLEVVFDSINNGWVTAASLVASVLFAGDIAIRSSRPIVISGNMAYVSGHGPLLADGSMPLSMLDEKIDRWVEGLLR